MSDLYRATGASQLRTAYDAELREYLRLEYPRESPEYILSLPGGPAGPARSEGRLRGALASVRRAVFGRIRRHATAVRDG